MGATIMSAIFGGAKSTSKNVNNDFIRGAFGGAAGATGSSINSLQALLGGDPSGFRSYTDAIDLSREGEFGSRGVTGTGAARGLLRSGATGMGLKNYEQMLENRTAGDYMQNLIGTGQLGLGAGGLIADTGKQEKEKKKPGMGGFLGQAAAGFAKSDERLKTDITPVGKNPDGLTVYQYRYKGEPGVFIGVMAQEVAERKPEALGPIVDGYMTVDYGKVDVINRSE
jgi:hypothetical protein